MNAAPPQHELPREIFPGGGAMGELVRRKDWTLTPFGPIESWPQSLRTATALMLESTFAMVVAWGPEFRFLYNDRYRPVLGNKHPDSLGKPAREIFPEVWDDLIGPLFMRTRRGESVAQDDLYIPLHRHGYLEDCYFTISYSPIRDESGHVGGMLAVVAETTERVESERRMVTLRDLARHATDAKDPREACQNAAAILSDNAIDVPFALLYLLDDSGVARREATTGIRIAAPAPEAIAVDPADLARDGTGPAGPARVNDNRPAHGRDSWPIEEALRTGRAVVVDDVSRRFGSLPSGPYPESVHTALVLPLARPGVPTYGFLIAGVSARRACNDRYRDFLELAAEHITTAIANARALAEERRRADALAEIDRAKTAFFSNVSHEFRTPLTLMLGPIEDVLDRRHDALPPDVRAQLEVTHRNSLRLLKLVNTLLDFSRIEAGRLLANYEPVDLAAFTAELTGVFRAAVEKAGLELRVDCPPLPEPAFVDRDMWEKIVFNLLSNALKFTLAGAISVRVRQDGGHFEFSVTDTGVGIPDREMPNLFKRFHRIENVRSRTHEGSGIGLALVQELARLHGGTAAAHSQLGVGSTFTVRLPVGRSHLPADHIDSCETKLGPYRELPASSLTRVKAESFIEEALRWLPAEEAASRPPAAAPARPGSRSTFTATPAAPRILLADDNADMRNYVCRLLGVSYTVEAVADGEEALAAIRRQKPDLVLTDVMMPRLDGFGLLHAIREDPELRGLPVIFLSARAGNESSIEGYEAGADDYLIKPFTAREMLARVSSHLKMSRLRGEVARQTQRWQATAARSDQLMHLLPTGVCVCDNEGRVVFANRRLAEMLGREPQVGKPWRAFASELRVLSSEHLDADNAAIWLTGAAGAGRPNGDVELEIARPDGEQRTFLVCTAAICEPNRRPGGVILAFQDTTTRRRAERHARMLAALVASSDDAIVGKTLDGVIESWNAGAQQMFGYTAEEIVGQSVLVLIPPDRRGEEPAILERLRRGERIEHYETIRRHKNGRLIDVALTVSPIRNASGTIVGASKIARDITARRRADAQQRALLDMLASVNRAADVREIYDATLSAMLRCLDADRAAILLSDATGVMRFVAWSGLSDAYRAAVEGHSPWGPEEREPRPVHIDNTAEAGLEPHLRQVVEGEGIRALAFIPLSFERRLIGKLMLYYNRPHPFDLGELQVAHGIASQIAFAVERQRGAQALESLVEERTRSLRQAIAQMEEFSYSVSHDLRSPVRAMRGYAEVLQQDYGDRLGEEGRDLLGRIHRSGLRMDRLIQDLLTYSRLSRREISLERVALDRLLREVVQQYPETGRARIDFPDTLPDVLAHEPSLTQVFSNLLSNAVKFVAPRTRPHIRIGCEQEAGRVRLWFKDNGIGVPPEYQGRLFGMFERIHSDNRYEGTGIGLAIVRKAMERMNGKVGLHSDGVTGSCFWIELSAAPPS